MDVLITGAAGFIGRALVARLVAGAELRDAAQRRYRPTRLILADRVAPSAGNDPGGDPGNDPGTAPTGADDPAVRPPTRPAVVVRQGDLADRDFVASLVGPDTVAVFHLAGLVSGAAEADFDAGLAVNLDGTRALLDAMRADRTGRPPMRLVHTSSIAVYGQPMPTRIDDDTAPWPTLSYGMQKLACELLIGDLSRRGLVDGRSVRLSGVLVRPPIANGALSGFNSDLIREPLHGRPVVAPVSPAATIWVQSLARTVDNLIHAMTLDAAALGHARAVLLPAVAARIDAIVAAIGEVAGADAMRLVSYRPDPAIEPMFGRWPAPFAATRALRLGFGVDEDAAAIVRDYATKVASARVARRPAS